ncbi:MAG: hypothetical protein NVS2B8_15120 [Vulcanimicrobiaceae bacterium]
MRELMFERIVTAIETTVLGLWAGSMAGFAFIFAPIAIKWVPRMDVFASLIAATIRGIGSFGTVCGGIAIAASLARLFGAGRATDSGMPAPSGVGRLALARVLLVVIALAASAYESGTIIPRMEATASQIPGPIDSVPKADPRRVAYDEQHKASSRVYGAAFLCVVGALALAAFGRRRPA